MPSHAPKSQDFTQAAAVVVPAQRRKFRSDPERLKALRRLTDFWDCAEGMFAKVLSRDKFQEFESALLTSDMVDDEVLAALVANPKFFSVSMLPSQRREASRLLEQRHREQMAMSTQAKEDMWDKKLEWFKAALQADQCRMQQLAEAGPQVMEKHRALSDRHRRDLAAKGELAVRQYVKENMMMVGPQDDEVNWQHNLVNFIAGLAWPSAGVRVRGGDAEVA
jgi:hypothetical protein